MKNTIALMSLGLVALLMGSCQKDNNSTTASGTAALTIRMTDGPGNYDKVNIDLQSVEIMSETEGKVMLNTNPGVYNLLDFSNGMDTVIATGTLKTGNISQVRLILGSNSSVVVGGQTYPLATPSAEESGLKLQLQNSLVAGVSYSLLLDFDASKSIVQQGNGGYLLKPVIRLIDSAVTGAIMGSVSPVTLHATITAEAADSVSYSTVTNASGSFLLRGVPQGTYTVTITPDLPALPVIINNVTVTTGASTDLNIITL